MQLAAGDRDRRAFDLTPTLAAVKILYTAPRGPHLSRVRSGHRIAPPPKHSFGRLLRIWIPHPSPGGPWGVAPPPGAVQGAPPPLKPLRLRIPCGTSPWTALRAPLKRQIRGLRPPEGQTSSRQREAAASSRRRPWAPAVGPGWRRTSTDRRATRARSSSRIRRCEGRIRRRTLRVTDDSPGTRSTTPNRRVHVAQTPIALRTPNRRPEDASTATHLDMRAGKLFDTSSTRRHVGTSPTRLRIRSALALRSPPPSAEPSLWLRHDSGETHAVEARCQCRSPLRSKGCEPASSIDNESGVLGGRAFQLALLRRRRRLRSGPC